MTPLFRKLVAALAHVVEHIKDAANVIEARVEDRVEAIQEAIARLRSLPPEEIARRLDLAAARSPVKLDWRHSVVDLEKTLNTVLPTDDYLDTTLAGRRAFAAELGYGGDPEDTATMNTWLHDRLMRDLGHCGFRLPVS